MNIPLSNAVPAAGQQTQTALAAPAPKGAVNGEREVLPWLEQQTALTDPGETNADRGAEVPAEEEGGFSLWGEDGFDFWDIVDIINPLQHIPVVSSIYRELTGDEIGAAPRMAGGFLFGGPIGLAVSGANVAVEAYSGQDVGEHAIAFFKDAAGYGDDVVVAGADAAAGGAGAAAPANDPVALAQQAMAADSAGWARVQANAAAGNSAPGVNAFTSANPFGDVVSAAPVQQVRTSSATPATMGSPAAATPNELGAASTSAGAFTAKTQPTKWFPVNKPRNPNPLENRSNPFESVTQPQRDVTALDGTERRSRQPQLSEQQIKSAILQAKANSRGMNAPVTSFSARKATAEAHAPVNPADMMTPSTTVKPSATTATRAAAPATTGSSLVDAQAQAMAPAAANPPQLAESSADPGWFTQAMERGLSKYHNLQPGSPNS